MMQQKQKPELLEQSGLSINRNCKELQMSRNSITKKWGRK
jgi:hypothetical protein